MATIDISRSHSLPIEEAKKRAEDLAKGMESKLGLVWKWAGDKIDFHAPSGAAKGAKGTVSVSASSVRVEIDLPFMLKMMKGTIEDRVTDRLKELLPA